MADDQVKPRSRGAINASPKQQLQRHVGRMATLRQAIAKAERQLADIAAGKQCHRSREWCEARIAALSAERAERLAAIKAQRDELDAVLNG